MKNLPVARIFWSAAPINTTFDGFSKVDLVEEDILDPMSELVKLQEPSEFPSIDVEEFLAF